jgi:hypothetical protein
MDRIEGVSRADRIPTIECVDCDAVANLRERDASKPADIGWLHRHDENGIENYCPDCRPDQQESTEADS